MQINTINKGRTSQPPMDLKPVTYKDRQKRNSEEMTTGRLGLGQVMGCDVVGPREMYSSQGGGVWVESNATGLRMGKGGVSGGVGYGKKRQKVKDGGRLNLGGECFLLCQQNEGGALVGGQTNPSDTLKTMNDGQKTKPGRTRGEQEVL